MGVRRLREISILSSENDNPSASDDCTRDLFSNIFLNYRWYSKLNKMDGPTDFRSGFELFCILNAAGINTIDTKILAQLINASLYKNYGTAGLHSDPTIDTIDYSQDDCVGEDPFKFFRLALDGDETHAALVKVWLGLTSRTVAITAPMIAAKHQYSIELSNGFSNNIIDKMNSGIFNSVYDCSNSHKCVVIDGNYDRKMLVMSTADNSSMRLIDLCGSSRYLQEHVVPLLMNRGNHGRVILSVADFSSGDIVASTTDLTESIDRWIVGKIPDYQKIIDQDDALVAKMSLRVIPSQCLGPLPDDVEVRMNRPTLIAIFNQDLHPEFMTFV